MRIEFNGDEDLDNGEDEEWVVEKIREMVVDEVEVELDRGRKGVVIDG